MDFKVRNTKICIDYSFFLLLSFAVFYGYRNAALIILFSCLHELGHLACLVIFKAYPSLIKISFYGISLKYKSGLSQLKELLVIICGPLINLILYILFKDSINLMLFIINMYPVLPLDGGRIIYTLSEKASKAVSFVFLIILFIAEIYLLIEYRIASLFFISVYLIAFNFKQMRFI